MPTRVCDEVFVAVTEAWRPPETSYLLNIPSPTVLSYFSNRIISGPAARTQQFWRAARSERAVAVLLSYLLAFRDGVLKRSYLHPRFKYDRLGEIVPISPEISQLIHDNGFLHIVRDTSFDAELSWVTYFRDLEVDWARYGVKMSFASTIGIRLKSSVCPQSPMLYVDV